MARYINPTEQYLDSAGNPLTGGKLYFYESGTLTLLTTYSDESEITANTNPVILDSSGRHGSVFFSTVAKVILKDQNDVQIWERDPVGSTDSDQDFASWSALFTYQQYDKVLGSDNLFYIGLQDSNLGNNPTTEPTWWNEIKFLGTYNANETYGDNAFVMDSAGLLWRSQQAANMGNTPTSANTTWWVSAFLDDAGNATFTGNIGVGGAPDALWTGSTYDALQVGLGASLWSRDAGTSNNILSSNVVYDGANYKAITTDLSSSFQQNTGVHKWYIGASVTAGASVTMVENMQLTADGNLKILVGNVEMTAGKGIDFSATANSSGTMTSELLDDYEEGTWIPTMVGGTSGAATYTTQKGHYTKIGRLVTITGDLETAGVGSVVGDIRISGLPFTTSALADSSASCTVGFGGGYLFTAGTSVAGNTISSTSYITMNVWDAGDGVTPMTPSEWSNNGRAVFSMSYITDS